MRTLPLCLIALVACSAPKHDYNAEQIAAEQDFERLMYVQATVADPRFKLAGRLDAASMTANDFEQFLDMGTRLGLTAARLKDFSKGKDFDAFAKEQGRKAAALVQAARGGDGAKTLQLARSIKKTCAACHSLYR